MVVYKVNFKESNKCVCVFAKLHKAANMYNLIVTHVEIVFFSEIHISIYFPIRLL